jgi:hypothetical protein
LARRAVSQIDDRILQVHYSKLVERRKYQDPEYFQHETKDAFKPLYKHVNYLNLDSKEYENYRKKLTDAHVKKNLAI